MPRRNRPNKGRPAAPPAGAAFGWARVESGPDGRLGAGPQPGHGGWAPTGRSEWLVRTVPGSQAVKVYRCPGCDHEIRVGVPHVVAWPADETGSVADRRHWHRACWDARTRRGPTRRG